MQSGLHTLSVLHDFSYRKARGKKEIRVLPSLIASYFTILRQKDCCKCLILRNNIDKEYWLEVVEVNASLQLTGELALFFCKVCVCSFACTLLLRILNTLGKSIVPQQVGLVSSAPLITLPHFLASLGVNCSFHQERFPNVLCLSASALFRMGSSTSYIKKEKTFLLGEERSHQILHFICDNSGRVKSDFERIPHHYVKKIITTVLFSWAVASSA